MLKWAARLFCKLLCRHRSFCPSSCSIFRPVLRVEPPAAYLQLIFLLLMAEAVPQASCSMVQSEPRSFDSAPCQTNIPGDCNPYSCHGTCEGRYARFWDSKLKIDRTVKSCQCVQEPVCSLIGMNAYAGCRTYNLLSTEAQRSIRLWTMSDTEKSSNRHGALSTFRSERYWDRLRHKQLLNSNSRFCCWTAKVATSSSSTLCYVLFSVVLPVLCIISLSNSWGNTYVR